MTVDDVSVLRCPISGKDLRFANADEIAELRADIAKQTLVHLDGSPVGQLFNGFLRTVEGHVYYPILDNVFILLSDFAILPVAERRSYACLLYTSRCV